MKAAGSRGVKKRKGTSVPKCRISTRNRSKVERLRESLNDLQLEERGSQAARSKACKNASQVQVRLGNRISDRGTCAGITALTDNEIHLGCSILKRHSYGTHTAVRSEMNEVNFDSSHQSAVEKYSSRELFQSDNKTVTGKYPSGMSLWCSGSENKFLPPAGTGNVNSPKRKHDKELLPTFEPLKNFKGTRDQYPVSAGACIFDGSDRTPGNDNDDDDSAVDKDQYSPSPPNSPLYDMPPPSTPAQKRERRAKRLLQLERWRKYEASKSRQERYERRAQETDGIADRSVLDSRRVQWSNSLVQTVYIGGISE